MFKKVKSQKLYMEIVDQVERLILENKLKPGTKLPAENKLAEEFGASRPTVREAISALEVMGLVESRKGKGNFVRKINTDYSFNNIKRQLFAESDPYEIFEARLTIEPAIIEMAINNAGQEDLLKLKDYLKEIERYTVEQDVEKLEDYDRRFHEAIGAATHNRLLKEVDSFINNKRKDTLWRKLKVETFKDPEKRARYLEEHQAIYRAIEERDIESAKEILKEHILSLKQDIFTRD